MGTKDVYNHAKKGQFKIQIKSIFYENVLELISFSQDFGLLFLGFFFFGYIFFWTLFLVILFPETLLIGSPRTFFKKVPEFKNSGFYFQ